MAIALGAGLGGVQADITAACGLGRNGNTLTLKPALAAAVLAQGAVALRGTTLAVVFAFSSHNYLLRHWLAAAGLDPDRDVRLTVVPPPQCPAARAALPPPIRDPPAAGETSPGRSAVTGSAATTPPGHHPPALPLKLARHPCPLLVNDR